MGQLCRESGNSPESAAPLASSASHLASAGRFADLPEPHILSQAEELVASEKTAGGSPPAIHYTPPVSAPLRGPEGRRGLQGQAGLEAPGKAPPGEALLKPESWEASGKGWNSH